MGQTKERKNPDGTYKFFKGDNYRNNQRKWGWLDGRWFKLLRKKKPIKAKIKKRNDGRLKGTEYIKKRHEEIKQTEKKEGKGDR